MTERTKDDILANEELALRRVTELARKNTDLRRDNARLRKWLRHWRGECNTHSLVVVTDTDLEDAMRGDAPPKGGKR